MCGSKGDEHVSKVSDKANDEVFEDFVSFSHAVAVLYIAMFALSIGFYVLVRGGEQVFPAVRDVPVILFGDLLIAIGLTLTFKAARIIFKG